MRKSCAPIPHTQDGLRAPEPGLEETNRYWDAVSEKTAAKLIPGQYYATGEDEMVVSVVGSCVCVMVRDPGRRIGGMAHFALPQTIGLSDAMATAAMDYGRHALDLLMRGINRQGGIVTQLEVTIMGGAVPWDERRFVADDTVRFVHDYFRERGIEVTRTDVGGHLPRKVFFQPASGQVFAKHLDRYNGTIREREITYDRALTQDWLGL